MQYTILVQIIIEDEMTCDFETTCICIYSIYFGLTPGYNVIIRVHSFRVEQRNLPLAAEFPCFRGILRNLINERWLMRDLCKVVRIFDPRQLPVLSKQRATCEWQIYLDLPQKRVVWWRRDPTGAQRRTGYTNNKAVLSQGNRAMPQLFVCV